MRVSEPAPICLGATARRVFSEPDTLTPIAGYNGDMARDCQSGGSARTERSDSPSNAEIASHVADRIEDYPGIGAPSRDDLVYFIVSNDHVSSDTARSWIRTALMAGRIYESQGGELNIIRW